jgi:hypothetical protein
MKNKLIIGLICLLASMGCSDEMGNNFDNGRVKRVNIMDESMSVISIWTIDSCEYIWIVRGNKCGLTHKGNCKNCKK